MGGGGKVRETCLPAQATVFATVIQNIPDEPLGAQQIAAPETQFAPRRSRPC